MRRTKARASPAGLPTTIRELWTTFEDLSEPDERLGAI
jgi:hypothetical protein